MSSAGRIAWGFVALLAILHYDFWNWDDRSLVFGFMPVGLYFQALISIGAAVAWAMVVKYAWPTHIEEWAEQAPERLCPDEDAPGRDAPDRDAPNLAGQADNGAGDE
jgi:hypothetical protein